MTRTLTITLILTLTFFLLLTALFAYTLRYLSLAQAYHQYTPPSQAEDFLRHIEQERLRELEQRVRELEDIFSSAVEFEITAYTDSCGTGDGYTATMTRPTVGRTIAVDPKVIPLGSRVWIEGLGVHIAEDVGGAIKGNIIDRYVGESKADAFRWGRRWRKVVVL